MKRILLISIVLMTIPAVFGYYQVNGGMMGELMKWLAGDEIVVDLSGPRPPEDEGTIERGKAVYEKHCSLCHGDNGDGRSIRSVDMQVKPRDLSSGNYRYRSTPAGSLPTDEDIYLTISRGIRGTGMLPWFGLSSEDKWAVTYFIKTFSERFASESTSPIAVPELPDAVTGLVDRGKTLFERENCWECHGRQGRGDGPLSDALKDDRGITVKLRSFASEPLKRGSEIRDIYISITAGFDGTPMASYGDAIPDEDILALSAYVNSIALQRPPIGGGMMEPVPITADEHAGMMMIYPAMPVGMMRYGMMKLYSESGVIKGD
jgi:mono/diheme cytochrome c family protein